MGSPDRDYALSGNSSDPWDDAPGRLSFLWWILGSGVVLVVLGGLWSRWSTQRLVNALVPQGQTIVRGFEMELDPETDEAELEKHLRKFFKDRGYTWSGYESPDGSWSMHFHSFGQNTDTVICQCDGSNQTCRITHQIVFDEKSDRESIETDIRQLGSDLQGMLDDKMPSTVLSSDFEPVENASAWD